MEEKFINSVLFAAESAELKKKVEKELEIEDPELQVAESILKEIENESKNS